MYTQIINNKRQYTGIPITTLSQFNVIFIEIFTNELKFEPLYSKGSFEKDGCMVYSSFCTSYTVIGFTENIKIIIDEDLNTTIFVDLIKKNLSLDVGLIFNIIFDILRTIWKDKYTAKLEFTSILEKIDPSNIIH